MIKALETINIQEAYQKNNLNILGKHNNKMLNQL